MDSDCSDYDHSATDSDCEPEICYRSFYGPPVECAWEHDEWTLKIAVARIPLILLPAIAERLQGGHAAPASAYMRKSLPRSWMIAIAQHFPDTPLAELRSSDPSLLPCWLLRCFHHYQDALVLRPEGIFARRPDAAQQRKRASCRQFIPASTLQCRFREGFASEGMLCNNPPIPLRVLDFLEDTEDLLNLALVCKATHQAGHVLLQREGPYRRWIHPMTLSQAPEPEILVCRGWVEHNWDFLHIFPYAEVGHARESNSFRTWWGHVSEFPGGLGRRPLTEGRLRKAIRQRKRGMLLSALRHPISSSTASASTPAPTTGTQACVSANARAHDPFLEFTLDVVHFDEVYPCIHHFLVTLLLARQNPLQNPDAQFSIPPTKEDLPHELDWHYLLKSEHAIVLDGDFVVRAVAELSKLKMGAPGEEERWLALRHEVAVSMASCWNQEPEMDSWPQEGLWTIECAEAMFKVVQAAEREGQGIIVF